jgi:DNA-binding HxlR family transcriptional regulator
MERTLRFNVLCRKLPSVTQRILTEQLRELEERANFPVVPPRVDCALTPLVATLNRRSGRCLGRRTRAVQ